MGADALALAHDRFDMPVERDDVGLDPDLLAEFARDGFVQSFADLDDASGQGEASDHGLPRPSPDEHLAIPKYRD